MQGAVKPGPATLNESERSVELTIATDTDQVRTYDYELGGSVPEILIMSGATYAAQAPLLDSHNRDRVADVLGSFREIRVEQGPDGPQLAGKNVLRRCQFDSEAIINRNGGTVQGIHKNRIGI